MGDREGSKLAAHPGSELQGPTTLRYHSWTVTRGGAHLHCKTRVHGRFPTGPLKFIIPTTHFPMNIKITKQRRRPGTMFPVVPTSHEI